MQIVAGLANSWLDVAQDITPQEQLPHAFVPVLAVTSKGRVGSAESALHVGLLSVQTWQDCTIPTTLLQHFLHPRSQGDRYLVIFTFFF